MGAVGSGEDPPLVQNGSSAKLFEVLEQSDLVGELARLCIGSVYDPVLA